MTGSYPFTLSHNLLETLNHILYDPFPEIKGFQDDRYSESMTKLNLLLGEMTQKDPNDRIQGMPEIIERLQNIIGCMKVTQKIDRMRSRKLTETKKCKKF